MNFLSHRASCGNNIVTVGLYTVRQKHKATFIVARSLVLADLLGRRNWTSCLLFRQLQAYELFLTAENNLRRVGISDLQTFQVTSLGKTKFDSLELLRGGE